jgi:hypothetical protein
MVGVSITKERKIGDLRQANIYLVVEFVIDTHQLKMIDKEIMGESGFTFLRSSDRHQDIFAVGPQLFWKAMVGAINRNRLNRACGDIQSRIFHPGG